MQCPPPPLAGGGWGEGAAPTHGPPPPNPLPQEEGAKIMTPEIPAALEKANPDKPPVVRAPRLPDGHQRLLPDPAASADLNTAAESVLQSDESGTVKLDG